MAKSSDPQVKAAGGIVVRQTKKGAKILLVHRPRYRDWTFPKGKLDPGEGYREAALREVEEETGFRCKAHRPKLEPLTYVDGSGRSKEVRYWLMSIKKGSFMPNDEVDLIAWVRPHKVEARLSYGRDQKMFRKLLESDRISQL
ncbi:MAG: NUDIX hydrolase [Acidimicrobiales bacterium]|nr:NUDIX hydrolase [Acidimicrobiales bacterium]RZV45554.1 MAG: NUDIX hydrolase [Acidimicrobiales bacterium]